MHFLVLKTMSVVMFLESVLSASFFDSPYSVPDPKIEVFERGFRVGIPDTVGVHLFAFHGNINYAMNGLEAGMFSRDILRKKGNEWVFEDRQTVLQKGDIIYFWLFVIKDNLGYRYDDGRHIVNEIVPYRPLPEADRPTTPLTPFSAMQPTPQMPTPAPTVAQNDPRCDLVLNLTDTVIYLTNDVKLLRETNQILTQIVEKSVETSRTLRFEGFLPPFDDARLVVERLVKEKLGLGGVNIVSATKNADKSVSFVVETLSDKIRLIVAAKDKLNNSKITLGY